MCNASFLIGCMAFILYPSENPQKQNSFIGQEKTLIWRSRLSLHTNEMQMLCSISSSYVSEENMTHFLSTEEKKKALCNNG